VDDPGRSRAGVSLASGLGFKTGVGAAGFAGASWGGEAASAGPTSSSSVRFKALSIADIAAEVGASVRALQAGFREWRQSTPMTELRRIRLQRVREALLEPDETTEVTDVALRWGFVHLGRFSAAYKTAFGEAPGITLRRRRPRARDRDENWTATPIRRR